MKKQLPSIFTGSLRGLRLFGLGLSLIGLCISGSDFQKMAGPTGLEPATSGVTGQRSNQLNYGPALSATLVGGVGFEPATPCV